MGGAAVSSADLLEGGIFDRLVHQAKNRFIIGTRFNGKAHTVVSDAIAQFAILEKSRRPEAHRKRIASRLYRDDFAGRLNNSRKHTGENVEKGESCDNASIALA